MDNNSSNQHNDQNPQFQQGQKPNGGNQSIYINQQQSNGMGTAGFVLSIVAIVVSWIPFVDFIVWLLGAIFSVIGLFKLPRGLAIAGTVISFIGFFIVISLLAGIVGSMNM